MPVEPLHLQFKYCQVATELVEKRMREDDETTAVQLHVLLTACDISISLSTILCSRSKLGWTSGPSEGSLKWCGPTARIFRGCGKWVELICL